MNALKCEMCNSTDLVKQDGVFVCQSCGTKYSVEEAKKMMIDGTVEVQGTVKVDNSSFVQKSLDNARRAKQKQDWEEVEKYYNLVEQNDPKNIEAIFYSAYGKARMSMVESDINKREQICGVFCKSISVIDDNYDVAKSEESQKVIAQMHADLLEMYETKFVYTETTDDFGFSVDNSGKTYRLFAQIALQFIESLENIIRVDDQLDYWKMIFEQRAYLTVSKGVKKDEREKNRELALQVKEMIVKRDATFAPPALAEVRKNSGEHYNTFMAIFGGIIFFLVVVYGVIAVVNAIG